MLLDQKLKIVFDQHFCVCATEKHFSVFKFSWLGLFHCISQWQKTKCKILSFFVLVFIVVAVQPARSSHAQHRWNYSLKSVSDLNWKNVVRSKTENSFWPANFVFVQLIHFFCMKISQLRNFQSLPDEFGNYFLD